MSKFISPVTTKNREIIADNIVAFMNDDIPLLPESISFIYNWVMTDSAEKLKVYYDVWDIVLKKYLPKERPVLFRSCKRISKRDIQCFTGKIYAAEKFSDNHTGHLLICDTEEYLQFEKEGVSEHERSFFPLCECIKKGTYSFPQHFQVSFYEEYKKEDEYIVRVNQNWLYDLKWNRKSEDF